VTKSSYKYGNDSIDWGDFKIDVGKKNLLESIDVGIHVMNRRRTSKDPEEQ
jgi:hypothetical protein